MKGLLTVQFKNGPDFGGIKREFPDAQLITDNLSSLFLEFWTCDGLTGFAADLIAWYTFKAYPEQTTLEGVKG